jgi:hypothetical protein
MQSTLNVGSAANGGSIPLPRLNPREIAVMLLPTAHGPAVNVMDATDEEFQAFVEWWCMLDIPVDNLGWSFDDRCRLINHYRKQGVDLFKDLNGNNSETIPAAELFVVPDTAQEAQVVSTHVEGDKLEKSIAFMQNNPQATDEMLADHLGMKRPASARFWRVKANSLLNGMSVHNSPADTKGE